MINNFLNITSALHDLYLSYCYRFYSSCLILFFLQS